MSWDVHSVCRFVSTNCFLNATLVCDRFPHVFRRCSIPEVQSVLMKPPRVDTVVHFRLKGKSSNTGHAWVFVFDAGRQQWFLVQSFQGYRMLKVRPLTRAQSVRCVSALQVLKNMARCSLETAHTLLHAINMERFFWRSDHTYILSISLAQARTEWYWRVLHVLFSSKYGLFVSTSIWCFLCGWICSRLSMFTSRCTDSLC